MGTTSGTGAGPHVPERDIYDGEGFCLGREEDQDRP